MEALQQGCVPLHTSTVLYCGRLLLALPLMQSQADAVARKTLPLPEIGGHKAVRPKMALQVQGYADASAPLSEEEES